MATVETLLTAEEFGELPDNGQRYRTGSREGRALEHALSPARRDLCQHRFAFSEPIWIAMIAVESFATTPASSPSAIPIAFAAWMWASTATQRVPKGPLPRRYLDVSPEVVFEVRSPGDRWSEIHVKIGEYLNANVKVVIVLDQQTETAHIYRPDDPPQILNRDDELTLPDILGDFRVVVRRFFE